MRRQSACPSGAKQKHKARCRTASQLAEKLATVAAATTFPCMHDAALIHLQEKLTHLEKQLSDLNEVVYSQQKTIDQLERAVQRLNEHIQSGGPGRDSLPFVRPPHA